jgi:hypothetical protein
MPDRIAAIANGSLAAVTTAEGDTQAGRAPALTLSDFDRLRVRDGRAP